MLIADDVLFDELDGELVTVFPAGESGAGVEHKAIEYAARVEDMDQEGSDSTEQLETVRWSIQEPSIALERRVRITQADNTSWKIVSVVSVEVGVATLVVANRGGVYRRGSVRRRPLPGRTQL